jgi:hypothetical protein
MREMTGQRKLILAASGAVILGAFLPWWSILGFSVNGVQQGDGGITLVLALVAAVLALVANQKVMAVVGGLAGLGIAGVGLYHVIDTATTKVFGATIGMSLIGSGLWITAFGGIALVALAVYGIWVAQSERTTHQPAVSH